MLSDRERTTLVDLVRSRLGRLDTIQTRGRVSRLVGNLIEAVGPTASVGDLCYVQSWDSGYSGAAEVVGFRDDRVLLMPLRDLSGICPGAEVTRSQGSFSVTVGPELLGRVINGLGQPIDGKGPLRATARRPIHGEPPRPLERQRIDRPIGTGIRAIDALMSCGRGQRLGIFAGSGVGKSVLLGMIAQGTSADVNVIALIGERGREVREFLERDLKEEGLRRSVVVVVTSDEMALTRLKGAYTATAIAEYFRDQGLHVILMLDSLTRVAMAQREIGLAVGEPPTARGYTPSTFTMLPKLLERAGTGHVGSITGLYTVLVEGDDLNDPVADTARSILDGHVVLSRELASRNHYPAIDPLQSVSRVMRDVVSEAHFQAAQQIIELLATHREAEDLVNIGAYAHGSNPRIDRALRHADKVMGFLRQSFNEKAGSFEEISQRLVHLATQLQN